MLASASAQQAGHDRPAQPARQDEQGGAQQAEQRVQADLHGGADRRRLPERQELEQLRREAHEDGLQVDGAVAEHDQQAQRRPGDGAGQDAAGQPQAHGRLRDATRRDCQRGSRR